MTHFERLNAHALANKVPLHVLFEITGRCSLDCRHCYVDVHRPPPELATREVKDAFEQLRAAGAMFLTVSGGEPFLRPDLLPLLAHARRLGFAVRLFTSGTRLTRADA
ncbi:MAG: radical SAM protein, partial [Myxococcota bacterium]